MSGATDPERDMTSIRTLWANRCCCRFKPAAAVGRILEIEFEYGEDERTEVRVLETKARCMVVNN